MIRSFGLVGLAALAFSSSAAANEDGISHTAEAIHHEPIFQAHRTRIYAALTDAKQFDKITQLGGMTMALGTSATFISPAVGGPFTLFGGHIIGRHIELVQGERIVQAWRVVDWKPGIYSIARFELVEQPSGAKIVFDHTGFPQGWAQHLASGWNEHYWTPLAKFFS